MFRQPNWAILPIPVHLFSFGIPEYYLPYRECNIGDIEGCMCSSDENGSEQHLELGKDVYSQHFSRKDYILCFGRT